jgi:hypothetical protein
MGTTPDQLDQIAILHEKGLLPFPAAIADFGAQQFHTGQHEDFARFARHFGKTVGDLPPAGPQFFTGTLFTQLGFRYVSFDVIDAPFVRRFDLNTDRVPWRFKGAFDLVLNFGTTEHVMSQFNAFRVIHDLCREGGLIYSFFVQEGCNGHGIVHYTDAFLRHLIAANRYEVIWESRHNQPPDKCTWIILKKTSNRAFQPIVDVE